LNRSALGELLGDPARPAVDARDVPSLSILTAELDATIDRIIESVGSSALAGLLLSKSTFMIGLLRLILSDS